MTFPFPVFMVGGPTGVVVGTAAVAFTTTAVGTLVTVVDRSYSLPAGLVYQVGMYNLTAGSYKIKIVQEDSATQFDCDFFNQTISHGGAGWQDFAVPGGIMIPGTGLYRMACANLTTTCSLTTLTFPRAVGVGDIVTPNDGGFASTTNPTIPLRATY